MKRLFICGMFLFVCILNSFAQVKTLELRDKVINLSSVTKPGHVTAFIFSIYGCAPCEKLQSELFNKYSDNKYFDIYHCTIGNKEDVKNWNTFKKTPAPTYWSQVERIYLFPTLFIFSPAGNLSYKYTEIDSEVLAEIENKIDYMLANLNYYTDLPNSDTQVDKESEKKSTKESIDTVTVIESIDTIAINRSNESLFQRLKGELFPKKKEMEDLESRLNRKIYLTGIAEFLAIVISIFAILKFKKRLLYSDRSAIAIKDTEDQ